MNNEAQTDQRHLNWQNCYNARDLGGLPTADGRTTAWHAIIRSDILGRLTADGRQALLDYGIKTIIDLRSPKEVQEEPSVFIQQTNSPNEPTYLNLPLEKYEAHVSTLIRQAKSRAEVYCIIFDHYPDMVANVMRAIISAPPGGIVIHCHAGKDRTGTISALLLRLGMRILLNQEV